MPRENTKKVPAGALRFDVGPLQFADVEQPNTTQAPVRIFARTPGIVEHWYWGRIVHDMAGLQHKDRIQLDWCHQYDKNVGYLDTFDADPKKGLHVSGQIVSFREDDIAAEILHRGRAGVPYEASIDWSGPARIEEVGNGMTAQVNGFTFQGPGYIVREWTLRAVAICPHGVDGSTKTEFAAADPAEFNVTLFSAESSMSQDTTKPAETQQADSQPAATQPPAQPQQDSQPQGQPPAQPAAPHDPRAQFTAELKRFTDKFGAENGAKWFAEGKSYTDALELHAQVLSDQVKAKDEALAAAHQKLSSVDRGEGEPVTFSEASGEGTDEGKQAAAKFAHLGEHRAKIAAGIKLPSAN